MTGIAHRTQSMILTANVVSVQQNRVQYENILATLPPGPKFYRNLDAIRKQSPCDVLSTADGALPFTAIFVDYISDSSQMSSISFMKFDFSGSVPVLCISAKVSAYVTKHICQ